MGRRNERGRDREVMKTKRNREREREKEAASKLFFIFAHKNVCSKPPSFSTFLGVEICKRQAY